MKTKCYSSFVTSYLREVKTLVPQRIVDNWQMGDELWEYDDTEFLDGSFGYYHIRKCQIIDNHIVRTR